MIEMTVRLDDDAAKELEQLRLEFCEKTSNKAILKAIKNYRKLLDDYQKTRTDLSMAKGFNEDARKTVDVDGFLNFSLTVQNRRKSRVGLAFEHHLEVIFKVNHLEFQRSAITENRSKPDFLFPGSVQYHDLNYDYSRLTMLGVKSTCKDRWRQVLSEADRILIKHLITLETAISKHQTDEMVSKRLQLIVPDSLQHTYLPEQRAQLMNLDGFINYVSNKQNK